jgi:hypothetical protein
MFFAVLKSISCVGVSVYSPVDTIGNALHRTKELDIWYEMIIGNEKQRLIE